MAKPPMQFGKNFEPDQSLIGQQVYKRSHKPFKSGEKIGTIKGYVNHPTLGVTCFTFEEDESYVACHQCRLV